MPKRIAAAAAFVAILFSALACDTASVIRMFQPPPTAGPRGTPQFHLASDKAGTTTTDSFSPHDTVYILIDARGVPDGVIYDVKWYGLDIFTADPNTPLAYQTVSHDGISPTVVTWFGSSNGLAAGHYRVDVYEDGAKIGEKEFIVQ
jgi:hypothetical protein